MPKPLTTARVLLLTAMVALGIAVGWGALMSWVYALVEISAVRNAQFEQLFVRVDGEPTIVRYDAASSSGTMQTLDIDGQPHEESQYSNLLAPQYIAPPRRYSPATIDPGGWRARLAGASDLRTPATYWYLVHDGRSNGSAYGVGYQAVTKTVAGYFGRQGFSTSLPPREDWFQVAGDDNLALATPALTQMEPLWVTEPRMYLLANQRLWMIDVAKRRVQSVLDCPGAESVGLLWRTIDKLPLAQSNNVNSDTATFAERLALVRFAERCTVVDPDKGTTHELPLPESLQTSTFSAYELAGGGYVFLAYSGAIQSGQQRVVWLDAQGQVKRQKEIELKTRNVMLTTFGQTAWAVALAAPLPPSGMLFALATPAERVQTGEYPSYGQALVRTLAEVWPALVALLAVSAALAVFTYRRQIHYSLPGAWLWAGFVFLFGLSGWLAYRFHRTWPVREDCPTCSEPAPRDRPACAECGANFPPPPQKGIEVFA